MHPAFSVIFLTTLIGVGQGLFLALYTTQLYSLFRFLPKENLGQFYAVGSLLAVVFLIGGLFASFFHLGHPERAWRSASKWRTSWLSREVIVLPVTMFLIALYGLAHYMEWTQAIFTLPGGTQIDPTLIIGFLATGAAFMLFVCTAMIYASLKFLQEWNSPLTIINFILLGGASGFTFATALSAWMGADLSGFFAGWAIVITVLGLISRSLSLSRNNRLRHKSSLKTAIGVRHPKMEQKAQGAMGGSFNTREFFHGKTTTFLKSIKRIFLVFAFIVPATLLIISFWTSLYWIPFVAFMVQYLGLLAERWYFFAEAKHPQNLYYQSIA